jgi:alpha-tubulin suppressor-like RCC1 family protein
MKKQFLLKSIFILVILTFPLITLSQIRWSWGKNDKGQLGDGTTQNVGIPEKLTDLSGVIDITGGTSHSCALLEDGTVWSWGQGGGTSSLTPVLSPVSNVFRVFGGGLYTLFLLNDGTMDSLGDTPAGPFVTNPVDIAAGGNHILFLLADGTVFAQGKNNFGQLGDGTTTDGFGVVPGLNGVVDIAAGWSFSVAVKDDGTVWTWGENNAGQLGNGTLTESHIPIQVPNISGIIKVACGAKHVLALNSDGNVWAWGFNAAGQLGLGYSSSDVTTPTKISNFNNIKDIFSHCGAIHSGALDNDGNLWLWGYDVDGEIGDGGGASVDSPKKIISGSIFIDNVGLGAYHTMISGWLGLLISPDTLPNAAVGSSYNQALTVQNGTAPYTFSISSGSLPNGMTITPAGVLSGTPTVAGIYSFTVEVVDSASGKGKRDYTLIVNNAGCPNLTITPATVPFGRVGTSYSQYISCTGGASPYTYSIHSGALPQGLNLSSSGLLSGTPSSSGTYSFTIIVQDGNTCFGSQNYTMTIYEPCATITISPSVLSDGKTGVLYNQTLSASGGTSPYTFTLKSGSLPPGLSVSSTGVISGTPSSGGTFSFTILATDSTGCVGTTQLTLFIYQPCPIITLTTTDLPKATAGNPYTYTLSAQNGTVPYSFSIISGNLPPDYLSPRRERFLESNCIWLV